MNKNTVIGIVLIGAILVGFGVYTSKEQKKIEAAQQAERHIQDSIRRANYSDTLVVPVEKPLEIVQSKQPVIDSSYGLALLDAAQGTQQFSTVENKFLKVTFSNKGGRIYSVQVKNYYAYDSLPVILFDGDKNDFSLKFFTTKNVETSSFFFTPVNVPEYTSLSETDLSAQLTYRLQIAENAYVDYVYTLHYESHLIDMQVKMSGMNAYIPQNVNTIDLSWTANILRQEPNFQNEANRSTVVYKYPKENSIDKLSESKESADKKIATRVEWIAFQQQFFSSILLAKDNFSNASIAFENNPDGLYTRELMRSSALMQLPYDNSVETTIDLQFYFGPNHYKTLKEYGHSFEKVVPMGGWFIGSINRWLIISVFDFLGKFMSNYGIIILLLTIFIKIILSPFSQKSIVSSAKMKLLKPEIDKINAKYPKQEDAMKKQQETMALYKKTGVSMLGGCLPMLLQMPILFAMFRFFPASFELRQEGFWWVTDLSSYDSILTLPFSKPIPLYGDHVSLFALLSAISTYFYSKMMMNQTPQTGQPGMKFMQLYFMPIFLLVLCNNFSAGLCYYYFLSNIITMLQTWFIRRFFIDEKKLYAKMQARAAATTPAKKKSRFQQMLEDAQKAQQQKKKK